MEARESSERKSLLIKVIMIIITLLLSFLATILYVFLYPKTTIILYDSDYSILYSKEVKKYSKLDTIPIPEKQGYTFLYWSYNDFGGEELDPNVEVSSDVVKLYANYQVNSYKVTYYIRYYNEQLGRVDYMTDVEHCRTRELDYGTEFNLPTGRDEYNNLIPLLEGRKGYHFAGWTTKIVEEDDPEIDKYFKEAGSLFAIDTPSDISLYAYWEKNQYTVNMHTGIKYELENGQPKKDANGDYIIKNLSSADDPTNENDSLVQDKVRYLNQVTNLTDNYKDFKLTEKNAGVAYDEYDFKGWYLDQDYTIGVDDYIVTVNVDDSERPYFTYKDKDGVTQKIFANVTSLDADGKPIYEFDLYSKWERRAYQIDFNKNSNRSNGKIAPIQLYKLILNEDGTYVNEIEKYYDDIFFTYEGYANGGHYSRINLETLDVVSQAFRDSNAKYRLIGWTINAKPTEEDSWYALWQQDPWTEELGASRTTGRISYDNPIYTHTESNGVVLFAQWSQVYDIKFAYASGSNQKNFIISGIEGEWFILPDINKIKEITGEEWTKTYNYFAGWTTGTSSLATRYLDKIESEGVSKLNPEFKYDIVRKSTTLIVLWNKTPFSIKFYTNDGTESIFDTYAPAYGGTVKYYPSAPVREGYLFDGWSKTKYADNAYSKAKREAKDNGLNLTGDAVAYTKSSSFKVDGDATYYASWTIDYTIKYDASGGIITSGKTSYKYSDFISSTSSTADLRINMYVGKGIQLTRENYNFAGWSLRIDNSSLSEDIILSSSTKRTTFDFYDMKYYDYKSAGTNIPDSDKKEIFVQSGNEIVLVARWTPKTYAVSIYDTLASSDTTRVRTDNVPFDSVYTFPMTNSAGANYDSKVGYKLEGFALDQDGTEGFKLYDPENMPTIDAGMLTGNVRYYTIYSQKEVTVEYRFIKIVEGETFEQIYTPTMAGVTVGKQPYGATIKMLPKVTGADYGSSKFMFRYWYYKDVNGNEVIVNTGDKIVYHDEQDKLVLYAKFEVEEYEIAISFTNPFDNNKVLAGKLVMNVEKDSPLTQEIYDEFMTIVQEYIDSYLSEYKIDGTILKGYHLDGLYTVGGYSDKFEAGKTFNPNSFTILQVITSGMTIETRWTANRIKIAYVSSESDGAETKFDDTVNLSYASSITLKDSDLFNLGGGLNINKWYLIDTTNPDAVTNREFFDCGSVLVGSNGKYSKLHDLSKYFTWDNDGTGTITLYANTQQTCTVNYYRLNNLGIIELVETVTFIYGETVPELLTNDDVIDASEDYKLVGWYYKGNPVSSIPVSKDNYVVDLYANFSIDIVYKILKIEGNVHSYEIVSTETVEILKNYDEQTGEYTYLTSITIDEHKVPTISSDLIPQGYTYYGLKFGEGIYSLEDIATNGVTVAIKGQNIELETYYTREYTLTYTMANADEKFSDGTTEDKVSTFVIGYDNITVNDITISYEAVKFGYTFSGWKIKKGDGTIGSEVYPLNSVINLTDLNTILIPEFNAPTAGTIAVKIILKNELRGTSKEVQLYNGQSYTFLDNQTLGWLDNYNVLYKWIDNDDNEYIVGDTFTIPLAVEEGTEYEFTGVWIEKYTIQFKQPTNYVTAQYQIRAVTLKKGEGYVLTETPTISTAGITFKSWIYDNNGTPVEIRVGDTIYLGSDTFKINGLITGTNEFYLPVPSGSLVGYELVGNWTTVNYNVKLNITDPSNSSTILTTVEPNNGAVPFGTTYTDRQWIPDTIIDNYEKSGNYGLVGWSRTQGATTPEVDILTNITGDMVLYSVWQNKVSVTFATSTSVGYLDNSQVPVDTLTFTGQVPGDTLDVNHLVKSIYAKGYTTVYFEDGTFKTYNNGANDYYQVVAFDLSWSTDNLNIKEDGSFDAIKIQTTDMTITPIIERVYKVSYFDNTSATGGNEFTNIPSIYVRGETGIDLAPELYSNVTRNGFIFVGWNINKDAQDKWENSNAGSVQTKNIYSVDSNTVFYAIWVSDRSVNFVATLATDDGYSTSRVISDFRLNRTNNIDLVTLQEYLDTPSLSNNMIRLNSESGYPVLDNHPAYRFNNQNLYLDGFIVTDKNGNNKIMSMVELGEVDFGSSSYDATSNIQITINFKEIYTIEYSTGDKDGTTGTINTPDYIVALDETRIGKLCADGTIGTMILPVPTVTRTNYDIYGWSTVVTDGVTAATRYNIESTDSMTLDPSELKSIISGIKRVDGQKYILYADWQYKLINIYVYSIADVINNPDGEDTTFVAPYPYYSTSTDGTGIAFSNTAKFIYVNGAQVYLNNYDFNKTTDTKIAQLRFNSSFSLRTGLNTTVGGFNLVGWSNILNRLGAGSDSYYFAIGASITITEEILTNGELKLYPVYEMITEEIEIYTVSGSASVTVTATASNGFVALPTNLEGTKDIATDSSSKIQLTRYHNATILAGEPSSDRFVFDSFTGAGKTDLVNVKQRNIIGTEYFGDNHDSHEHEVVVTFSPKKVLVNISLTYPYELKDMSSETTSFRFDGWNIDGEAIQNAVLSVNSRTTAVTAFSNEILYFSVSNNSNNYTYNLMSGGNTVILTNGMNVELTKLIISSEPNIDGLYLSELTIVATPIMAEVDFRLVKGVFATGTKVQATNNLYNNINEFEIVNNIAKVVVGSTITLPTADDINYPSGGAFEGFYLYGDESKTIVTSYTVTGKVTFIEMYNNNAYTIQYNYDGKVTFDSGIAHGTSYTIGAKDKDGNNLANNRTGYDLVCWTDELGNELFTDGEIITSLTRSYNLYAKYQGKDVTIKYIYDGNTNGRIATESFGQNFTTIKESDLDDATVYTNKYIAGWSYSGKFVLAGNETSFEYLGFTYADDATIEFTAVYYSKYEYQLNYVTTNLTNADLFDADKHFVLAVDENNTMLDQTSLKYTIKSVEPVNSDADLTFTNYIITYSIDGGSTYQDYEIGDETALVPGYQITLVSPFEGTLGTTILYELTPQFANNVGVSDVTYVIPNPSYNSEDPDDKEILYTDSYSFNTSLTLDDNYLPIITGYNSADNSNTVWTILGKSTTFNITHSTMDFRKFTLTGYTLEILDDQGAVVTTRTLTLGVVDANLRNVKGSYAIRLTAIWEENYLVKYFDHDSKEIIELREYFPYDSTQVVTKSLAAFNAIENGYTKYNIQVAGYTWTGWEELHKTDIKTKFEQVLTAKDYILYPIICKHYTIQLITTGIDNTDETNFVVNDPIGVQPTYTYLGINEEDTIDLSNYTYATVYSSYDADKYEFLGYSNTPQGTPSYSYTFDVNNTDGDNINIYAIWKKRTYSVNVEFVALDNNGVNKAEEYSLVGSSALVKYHGEPINLSYTVNGSTYNFVNQAIGSVVNNILAEFDYFKFKDIVLIYAADNIVNLSSYDINESTTITVRFDPVYRLTYYLYEGSTLEGYDENNLEIIEDGQTYTNKYAQSNIVWPGYTVISWAYPSYELVNNSMVFVQRDFFTENQEDGDDLNDSTIIDISKYILSEDYILTLYPMWNNDYTVNLYYMDSVEEIIAYNELLAINPNPTEAQKQAYYKKLATLDMHLGDSLLRDYVEATDTYTNAFDSEIANQNLTISGKNITTFEELMHAFDEQQYTSYGLVTINDDAVQYGATLSDRVDDLYFVQTYSGTYNVNNLYLTYSPVEYSLLLGTLVVNTDGSYNQELADNHETYSEFALTQAQIDDDGSNVDYSDQRKIGYSLDLHSMLLTGEDYYTYALSAITHLDSIYLFEPSAFVRSTNKGYNFIGWKIAEYELDGSNNVVVTYKDLSDLVVADANGMKTISGITSKITIVALFSVKTVTVNITTKTTNDLGHQLDVVIKGARNSSDTYTVIDHTMTPDSSSRTARTTVEVQFGSWLDISGIESNQFKISQINDGLYTFGAEKLNIQIDSSLMIGNNDGVNFVIIYEPIYYDIFVSTVCQNNANLSGEIETASYYLNGEKITTEDVFEAFETRTFYDRTFNYKTEVVALTTLKQDFAIPTLNNYIFDGWKYYDSDSEEFITIEESGFVVEKDSYLIAVFTPRNVTVRYFMDVTQNPQQTATKSYMRIQGLDTTVKVGDTITLPYVVVELDDRISSGWLQYDEYNAIIGRHEFGDTITVITNNNELFMDDGSGNLVFDFYATIIERYSVYYDEGNSTFIVDGSGYPTNLNEAESLGSVVYSDNLAFESEYYYSRMYTSAPSQIVVTLCGESSFVAKSSLDIPNYYVDSTNGVAFMGWMTENEDLQYTSGGKYEFRWIDDFANNHIVMYAIPSNYIELQFYVTNPQNTNEAMLLSESTTIDPNLTYLSVLLDKDNIDRIFVIDTENSNENFVTWKLTNINKNYFATNTLADGKTIINDYRFYGWSLTRYTTFQNIADVTGNDDVISQFNNVYVKESISAFVAKLNELIADATSSPVRLYSVWENRYEVKFTFNDETITSGMYAKGEKINAPNPNTHGDTIVNGTYKWLGWLNDINKDPDGIYIEDEYATAYKLYFDDNKELVITYEGGVAQEYITIWQQGYKLTLDMNFADIRTNFADILKTYTAAQDTANIIANTGYPYYAGTNPLVTPILSSYQLNIGETAYYTQYAYGDLWTDDEVLDISELSGLFIDTDIYPTISLNYATWLNSYYNFVGWSTTPNGDILDINQLQAMKLEENVTLYAKWTPVEFTISMYQTQEQAESAKESGVLSNYKCTITFGDPADMTYLEELAFNELAFIRPNLRFDRWIPISPMNDSVFNNARPRIINDLYLYPVYVPEYTVEFYTTNGIQLTNLDNPDLKQKVIEGESIEISSWLQDELNQKNLTFITDIYYYNTQDQKVNLFTKNANNKIESIDSTLTFSTTNVKVDLDHYVFIYVEIKANVVLNINPVDPYTNGVYSNFSVHVEDEQVVNNGLFIDVYNLDTTIYRAENAPIIEGWYFSNVSKEDAFEKNNKVNSFIIIAKSDGYYLRINNDETKDIKLDALKVNFYAKLVVNVSIELGEDDDTSIIKYAELSYTEISTAYPQHVQDLIENSLIIEGVVIGNTNYVKAVSYQTLFDSSYHLKFMLKTTAYNITSISGLFTPDELEHQLTATTATVSNTNTTDAQAVLQRTVNKTTVDDQEVLQIEYLLQFNSISKSGDPFRIAIEIHKVAVQFAYNTDEAVLRYKQSEYSGTYMSFDLDEATGSHGTDVDIMYDSSVADKEITVISLAYTIEKNGKNIVITYNNVPYGTKMYIIAIPSEVMLTHFEGWDAEWSTADDSEPTATVSSIKKDDLYIQFYPSEYSNQSLITNYKIEAKFNYNKINGFKLLLDFEADDLENADDSLNPWGQLLANYSGAKAQKDTDDKLIRYTVEIELMASATKTAFAGDDLSDYLANLNIAYHINYDKECSTVVTDPKSLSLEQLLQYFWFGVENWTTDIKTLGITTDTGVLIDNIIYAYDGSTVVLHKNMSRAIIVDTQDRTLDYTTETPIADIDRADITLENYAQGSYVFTDTTNRIVLKTPFSGNVNLKVTPHSATAEHSEYILNDWKFVDMADGVDGTNIIKVSDSGRSKIAEVSFEDNLYPCFVAITAIDNSKVLFPELRLRADVVAKTHNINFINTSNDEIIKTISIAYDKAIYEKDMDKYYYYSYTLNNLGQNDSKHTMPRFKLMDSPGSYAFAHNDDGSAQVYGDFKYIFKGWMTTKTDTVTQDINNVEVVNNLTNYGDINLYTNYIKSKTIKIVRYNEDSQAMNYSLYLVQSSFNDDFGNSYSDDGFNKTKVLNFIKMTDRDSIKQSYEYFVYKDSTSGYVAVDQLQDLIDLGLSEDQYIIYPKIEMKIKLHTHNMSEYKDYAEVDHSVDTLGGKLILSMLENDNASLNYFRGYLVVSNLVGGDTAIAYNSYGEFVFAFWRTDRGDIKDYVTSLEFSKSSSDDYKGCIDVTAVYNPKFTVLNSAHGSTKIEDASGQTCTDLYLAINNSAPTGLEFNTSVEIKYESFGANSDGANVAILKVRQNGEVVYTIKFSTMIENATVIWDIFKELENTHISLNNVNDITHISDGGYLKITPLVIPDDVTLNNHGFVITNLPGQYTDAYSITGKTEIKGGSSFNTNPVATKFGEGSSLNIVTINNEVESNVFVATANSSYNSLLSDKLTNFRWQYKTVAGSWIDIVDGSTADIDVIDIRFAADWISTTITFAKLSSQSTQTNGIGDKFGEFSLTAGNKAGGLEYTEYNIGFNSEIRSTVTYEMLKGESLIYNSSSMSFDIVTTIASRTNQKITILNTNNNGYVQGWLRYDSKLAIITSEEYTSMSEMTYYAWVEEKITINLDMDMRTTDSSNQVVEPGYGIVKYSINNLYNDVVNTQTTTNVADKSYGSITCGVSSIVSIKGEHDPEVGHSFVETTYSIMDGDTEATYHIPNLSISACDLSNTTLKILFNAKASEKQMYIAYTDLSMPTSSDYKIYGGYKLKITDKSSYISVEFFDHFGQSKIDISIYKQWSDTGSITDSIVYPRQNYRLDDLNLYTADSITTSGNKITDIKNGSTAITLYDSGTVSLQEFNYRGTDNLGKHLVLNLKEYIAKLTLNFSIKIKDVEGNVTTATTVSTETAYLESLNSGSAKEYTLGIKDQKASLQYNSSEGTIALSIGDNSKFIEYIKTGSLYDLESASIYPSGGSANTNNTCKVDTSTVINMDLTNNTIVLEMVIQESREAFVALKFSLLNKDMENIGLHVDYGDIDCSAFNQDDGSGNNTYTVTINKGDSVYVEKNNQTKRTYLKFYSGKRNTGSGENLGVYLIISYSNNCTTDYNIMGSNGYGWWIDESTTHLSLGRSAKTIRYTGSATKANTAYEVYSYTRTTEIGTQKIKLNNDCSIVLDLERKPVYIVVDNKTTKYWTSKYNSVTSTTNEDTVIKDGINNTATDGSLYVGPSGLVSMTFPFDQNSSHYIKLGRADLDLGNSVTASVTPTIGRSGEKAFAIVSSDSVDYNIYLLGSNRWKLIDIPYGATNIEKVPNHIEAKIHVYPKGINDSVYVEKPLDRSTKFSFITTLSDGKTKSFNLAKQYASRLYVGFDRTGNTNYATEVFTFDSNMSSEAGYRRLIIGYQITDDSGKEVAIINETTEFSISSLPDQIHIYAIWDSVKVHTVTIETKNGVTGGTWYVLNGYPFSWSHTLNRVELNNTPTSTAYFYTKVYGSQVFMGLTTSDIGGNFELLSVSSTKLSQHGLGSASNSGGLSGTVYEVSIASVTKSITFYQSWTSYGRKVTYDCATVYHPTYTMRSGYTTFSQISKTYSLMVDGMYHPVGLDALPEGFSPDYFKIETYYKEKAMKTAVSGTSDDRGIWVKIKHTSHGMTGGGSSTSYEWGYNLGKTGIDQCYQFKNTSTSSSCICCVYSTSTSTGWIKTSTVSHAWVKSDTWSSDATNHWHTQSCSRCGTAGSNTDVNTHKWGNAVYKDATYHTYTCTVCGRTKYEAHSGGSYTAWKKVDSSKHERHKVCTKCNGNYSQEKKAHNYDYDNWEEFKAPTCTETGYYKYPCKDCEHVWKMTLSALGHASTDEYIFISGHSKNATCTADGCIDYGCTRCLTVFRHDKQTATGHNMRDTPVSTNVSYTYTYKASSKCATRTTTYKYKPECINPNCSYEKAVVTDVTKVDVSHAWRYTYKWVLIVKDWYYVCDKCGTTKQD